MHNDNDDSSESTHGSFVPPDPITPEEIVAAVKAANEKELQDAKKVHAKEIKALRAKMTEERDAEMKALRVQFAAALLGTGISPDLPASSTADTAKASSGGPLAAIFTPPISVAPPTAASFSGTFHDLLGDFLPTERSEVELENASMQVISKADRLRLSAADRNKVYTSFSKGITSKFKASTTIVGLDEVSTIENIMSFSQLRLDLQHHITAVSAHPVFLILKFLPDGTLIDPDSSAGKPINILSATILPSLEEIVRSTFFHFRRGTPFSQENLIWTYEAIRNSCDKDLQVIIDAKMLKYKPIERFGPLLYYELAQQMTNVDSKAVRAITQELTALKIPDQEGQSIAKKAKYIRSTIIWLQMVNMLPPDIDAIVYDILETCTVPDFQLFLKTLSANANLNGVILSSTTILDKAEEHYRFLILSKR